MNRRAIEKRKEAPASETLGSGVRPARHHTPVRRGWLARLWAWATREPVPTTCECGEPSYDGLPCASCRAW